MTMRSTDGAARWVGRLLVPLLLGARATGGAQEPADTARLEPVVVTANRMATPVANVSAAVSVLDGRELEARGITSVAEALRDVAAVDVVRNGSYGGVTSAFVRGGEGDYVKVLVDGVPLNEPGGVIDLADLTTDNIERIEIVRGPVSVLYGSDAVSGVVQVFTRRGTGALHGDVRLRAGTYTAVDASGGIAGGTETIDYAIAAARSRTDGVYPSNNEYANTVWSGTVGVSPDDRSDARLTVRYGASEYHYPTDGVGAVVDENAFQRRDRIALGIEAVRAVSRRLEVRAGLALSQLDGGIDDRPDGPADTLGYYAYSSVRTAVRRSADVRANAFLPANAVLTVGGTVEWQRERSVEETQSEYGPGGSSFDATRTGRGVYAQLQAEPLERLALTVGGRLDHNSVFGTFMSYRGGISYGLPTGTRIRAAVGTAFKEPTFLEHFADGPFARGNPELRPERTASWEAGVEQSLWGDRVVVTASWFSQRFRDLVQYAFVPPEPGAPNFFNVAAADAEGVESGVALALPLGFHVTGTYTYLRTAVVDAGPDGGPGTVLQEGARLLRRPTYAWGIVARRRFGVRGSVSGTLRHVGDRDDLDFTAFPSARVVLPSYLRVDVAGEVRVWGGRARSPMIALTGRLENVFGADYSEVFGFRTPGRTIAVGIRAGL
jgi:vitamin B12 transporter